MIVVVVGMHRSGTSTVAGLLHKIGVTMGEERVLLPRPSAENPRGFFENRRFRDLNDLSAERSGYRVKSWRPEIPACRPGRLLRLRMRLLLRTYSARYHRWGFKDPRTCLTLDAWLAELERLAMLGSTRVVYVSRDPESVARSLQRRNGIERAAALRLWKAYNERALAAVDAWRPQTFFVRYEELCTRTDPVTRALCQFVGAPTGDRIAARFVDARLDRSSAERPVSVACDLSESVAHVREKLVNRARASQQGEAMAWPPGRIA